MTISKFKDFEGRDFESAEEFIEAFLDSIKDIKGFEILETSTTSIAGVNAEIRTFIFNDDELIKTKLVVTEKFEGYFYLLNFMSSESAFDKEEMEFDKMLTSVKLK